VNSTCVCGQEDEVVVVAGVVVVAVAMVGVVVVAGVVVVVVTMVLVVVVGAVVTSHSASVTACLIMLENEKPAASNSPYLLPRHGVRLCFPPTPISE
jgi:hypothetical protein